MLMEYAYKGKPGIRTARARLEGINVSYKDLCEVARNVRGKDTEWSLDFLGRAAEGEQAILFLRNCKGKGHRRELGGKKGGFPVKSAKFALLVLENAHANAQKLGLATTKIAHIQVNKQDIHGRMSPKGRRIRHDFETAFIEVVLEEVQKRAEKNEKAAKAKTAEAKQEKKAPEAAKPAAAKPSESKA
jgi:ribosomal protein uL22